MTLGWREWIALPDLGINRIKAKIDTGARSSALHAFEIRPYCKDGAQRVEFKLHPRQRDKETVLTCDALVVDQRLVSDSGGHKEQRWVIQSDMMLGADRWPIEITLTARDDMLFRMLIGRTAITHKATVDPSRSYVVGKRAALKSLKTVEG